MYICQMKLKDETKRISIVAETIDIVFDKGFAGVKMAELARKVGVSPSTLYVYYKNKEDLIVSIATEIIKNVSQSSNKEVKDGLPYKLKLRSVWFYWLDFGINHSKEMSFLHQVKQSPYYKLIPSEIKDAKAQMANSLLDLGKKEGLIKNVDNEILSAVIGSMMSETIKLILSNKLKLDKKDNDLMFSLMWDAIKS